MVGRSTPPFGVNRLSPCLDKLHDLLNAALDLLRPRVSTFLGPRGKAFLHCPIGLAFLPAGNTKLSSKLPGCGNQGEATSCSINLAVTLAEVKPLEILVAKLAQPELAPIKIGGQLSQEFSYSGAVVMFGPVPQCVGELARKLRLVNGIESTEITGLLPEGPLLAQMIRRSPCVVHLRQSCLAKHDLARGSGRSCAKSPEMGTAVASRSGFPLAVRQHLGGLGGRLPLPSISISSSASRASRCIAADALEAIESCAPLAPVALRFPPPPQTLTRDYQYRGLPDAGGS